MAEFQTTTRPQETVFDVSAERLGRVYAQAALDAAGNLDQQQEVVEELESVVNDVLSRDPRLNEIFSSELISEDEKLGMLDRIFAGRASKTTLHLLKVMARHDRLAIIRNVAKAARELWQTRANRIPVELETANPVEKSLQQEILKAFEHALGADPIVTDRVNPDLIAGFVIRVGDRVYDGSVRTRLEHMRQGMINRAVEAIQRGPTRFIQNGEATEN
jgi:F-type H+-transporting ATPase subunit delta